jgi:hypothetical protein
LTCQILAGAAENESTDATIASSEFGALDAV